jgi:hypothetical protein
MHRAEVSFTASVVKGNDHGVREAVVDLDRVLRRWLADDCDGPAAGGEQGKGGEEDHGKVVRATHESCSVGVVSAVACAGSVRMAGVIRARPTRRTSGR